MKTRIYISILLLAATFVSCKNNENNFDASGSFEVDETVVSSELNGKILSLNVEEGQTIPKDSIVAVIDAETLSLQKQQVEESINVLKDRTNDVSPSVKLLQDQLAVQESQLNNYLLDKTRIENLVKMDAATTKQLDDMKTMVEVAKKQIVVTQQQIAVQKNNVATQNRGVMSEGKPLKKQVAQLANQLSKANVLNPVSGTVITKYAEEGEITTTGKALYSIADMSVMTLRAYISGTQLSQVKLNQPVKVFIDNGPQTYKELPGTITWISSEAEFTPKTIQTKDERANLVYAVKITVKNDGYLKIGMYGQVTLAQK